MLGKLSLQKELFSKLALAHPELGLILGQISDPDQIMKQWKSKEASKQISSEALELIRELKVNKFQYNQLIKKAPYNWVAKISGLQPI